jgi:hypothetical protein
MGSEASLTKELLKMAECKKCGRGLDPWGGCSKGCDQRVTPKTAADRDTVIATYLQLDNPYEDGDTAVAVARKLGVQVAIVRIICTGSVLAEAAKAKADAKARAELVRGEAEFVAANGQAIMNRIMISVRPDNDGDLENVGRKFLPRRAPRNLRDDIEAMPYYARETMWRKIAALPEVAEAMKLREERIEAEAALYAERAKKESVRIDAEIASDIETTTKLLHDFAGNIAGKFGEYGMSQDFTKALKAAGVRHLREVSCRLGLFKPEYVVTDVQGGEYSKID